MNFLSRTGTRGVGTTVSFQPTITSISSSLGGSKYEKELEILGNYRETFTKSYELHSGQSEATSNL